MSNQEITNELQSAIDLIIQTTTEIDPWAVEIAVEALEKQIPKKPEKSKIPRYGMGYAYYDWCCPTCGRFLAFEPSKGDHHCYCGQAIDWEEE